MRVIVIPLCYLGLALAASEVPEPVTDALEREEEGVTPEVAVETTAKPGGIKYPCVCGDGRCSCCIRQRLCLNVLYDPDEFEFNYKFLFNERVLYQNKLSAKNPRPVCLPISRWIRAKACVKFSNVYMVGRNLHACTTIHGEWLDFELFEVDFECFRIGANGVALVRPEDGGGIPLPSLGEKPLSQLDYDDSA